MMLVIGLMFEGRMSLSKVVRIGMISQHLMPYPLSQWLHLTLSLV